MSLKSGVMTADVIWSSSSQRQPFISRVLVGVKMLKPILVGLSLILPFAYMAAFHLTILFYILNAVAALVLAYMLGSVIMFLWEDWKEF